MLLELEHVEKRFAHPSGEGEIVVLKDISMEVAQGEAVAVIGPSGSGKSTLLNIIGALDAPTAGVVKLGGQDLAGLGNIELSEIRNRQIGFVFQLHHLLPQCTVLENVLIPIIPYARDQEVKAARSRAHELLERVGLKAHMEHFPAQLSGGEMQRVAVVRALINQPRLVLADEPTGSLDRDSSQVLGRLLVDLNKEQETTLVIVTHSLELAQLLDKVYQLQAGNLVRT
jgi:ABC-type lipoprotein export system ATPase subunit